MENERRDLSLHRDFTIFDSGEMVRETLAGKTMMMTFLLFKLMFLELQLQELDKMGENGDKTEDMIMGELDKVITALAQMGVAVW